MIQAVPALSSVGSFLRISLLIAANLPTALLLSRVECVLNVGRSSLYMVGNEVVIKTVVPTALAMIGLSCSPSGELGTTLYCAVLLLLTERFILPIERPLLDILQSPKPWKEIK